MDHNERVEAGYRFYDLNTLSPAQWASIAGLARGKAKYEELRMQAMESKSRS